MWRHSAAGEQRNEVTLECSAHDAVDDGILRAVRMSEQQRQRTQPRYPARARLHSAAVRRRHRTGRGEVEVEVDDVVGQPEGGEESGDQQQHDGSAPSSRQRAAVSASHVTTVTPQQGGMLTASQQSTAGGDVRRHDDHSGDNVDEHAQSDVERLTGKRRRPVLVTEVQLFATVRQSVTVERPHRRQRRHDDTRHHPRGAQSRRYDNARRREIPRFDRMPHGDVSVNAQQHYRHNARANWHSCHEHNTQTHAVKISV